jgi:hypothetical protein
MPAWLPPPPSWPPPPFGGVTVSLPATAVQRREMLPSTADAGRRLIT